MATKPISEIVAETIALNYPSIDGLTQALAQGDVDADAIRALTEGAAERAVADHAGEAVGIDAWGYSSLYDGAPTVQIDTTEDIGRVCVWLNDGLIYDGDPEYDEAPGRTHTIADLDGTDDAADWLTAGHVLDAQEVEWLRTLRVVAS
ncbi:hypothetical protein [Microbacterium aurum]